MKKIGYLFSLLLIMLSSIVNANHFSGHSLTLISQGNDLYKFRLVVYADLSSITPANDYFTLNLYKNIDNTAAQVPSVLLTKLSTSNLNYDIKDCPPVGVNGRYSKNIYESSAINLSSLNSIGGYYAVTFINAGTNGILNLLLPYLQVWYTAAMDFPNLNTTSSTRKNSAPEFIKDPLNFYCLNKTYNLSSNVVDIDGDSLVYYSSKVINGDNALIYIKPFIFYDYNTGYNFTSNIADGDPDFSINKQTGYILYKPKKIGKYLVAIRVEEWKRATPTKPAFKIGEIRREFEIKAVVCPNEYEPKISDINNRLNTIRDTINVKDTATYFNRFISKEQAGDSVFMKLVPEQGLYNNIFNTALFDVSFGKVSGSITTGTAINDFIINSKDSLKANFTFKIDSTDIKRTPYKFKAISFDKTCPVPLADTIDVELYILGQCYANKQISITGCDSVVDLLGRKHFANAITIDSLKGLIGCDTIIKQIITINKSTAATIVTEGCDSVMALDGNIYYQNTTVKKVINNLLNCDSIITQNIIVNNKPVAKLIRGDAIINDAQPTYYYGTDLQNGIQYLWKVSNGNIITGQGTNLAEVQWLANGNGTLTSIVYDNQLSCSDSSKYTVNISTGIKNIKNSHIKIYPNPTINIINIEGLDKNENNTIQIFDVQGKLVITKTINEKGTIDLSELNKGVYVIKIGELAQRIVKM